MATVLLACLVVVGCKNNDQWQASRNKPKGDGTTNAQTETAATATIQPIASDTIANLYRVTENLFSGGQPVGDAAFGQLKSLGVKTIISVDGVMPDVARAKQLGMRYVHLPITYSDVTDQQAIMFVKAAKTLDGPIYIHCHHGKHRGPTAAAFMAMANELWSNKEAIDWMNTAGTSPQYQGLYNAARKFRVPNEDELNKAPDRFPERATLPSFPQSMAEMGEVFSRLEANATSMFQLADMPPNRTAEHAALLLEQHFQEMLRQPAVKKRPEPFQEWLEESKNHAGHVYANISSFRLTQRAGFIPRAHEAMTRLSQSCKQCHRRFRN